MNRYEKSVGKSNGVGKLLEIKNNKTGIFLCLVCNKKYEGNLHSWYYQSKKTCTHKNTNHKLYDRYSKMIRRCYDINAEQYKYYGARGIGVCERWLNSFDNFLIDMESTYRKGLELDRIDNDKGYSPENCKWVTHSENMLNRRGFKNKTGYPGVRKSYNKFLGRYQKNNINYQTKQYDTPEQAYKALQDLKMSL